MADQNKKADQSVNGEATSPSSQGRTRPQANTVDWAAMPASERVKLGYEMARKRFSEKPSACFKSRTVRDPNGTLNGTNNGVSPQMKRRQEMQEQWRKEQAEKSGYDPDRRDVQSDFNKSGLSSTDPKSPQRSTTAVGGGSPWARDKTARRLPSGSVEIIPSSREPGTPGPGSYTSELRFVGL